MGRADDRREQRGSGALPPFRVLCVDDNRDCADSEALLLRVVGFDALAGYDGETALRLNGIFRPGLCLLDLDMPGMGGDELAVRLMAGPGWKPLLLVAVTARSDDESRRRTGGAGFGLHLVKPVDPGRLLEVVGALLRAAQPLAGP